MSEPNKSVIVFQIMCHLVQRLKIKGSTRTNYELIGRNVNQIRVIICSLAKCAVRSSCLVRRGTAGLAHEIVTKAIIMSLTLKRMKRQ